MLRDGGRFRLKPLLSVKGPELEDEGTPSLLVPYPTLPLLVPHLLEEDR